MADLALTREDVDEYLSLPKWAQAKVQAHPETGSWFSDFSALPAEARSTVLGALPTKQPAVPSRPSKGILREYVTEPLLDITGLRKPVERAAEAAVPYLEAAQGLPYLGKLFSPGTLAEMAETLSMQTAKVPEVPEESRTTGERLLGGLVGGLSPGSLLGKTIKPVQAGLSGLKKAKALVGYGAKAGAGFGALEVPGRLLAGETPEDVATGVAATTAGGAVLFPALEPLLAGGVKVAQKIGRGIKGVATPIQVAPRAVLEAVEAVRAPDGGYTLNTDMTQYRGGGKIVSVASEVVPQEALTPEVIGAFRARHEAIIKEHPHLKVGVFNMGDGQVSIDLNAVLGDVNEATALGVKLGEKAIFDADTMTLVPTGGAGTAKPRDPTEINAILSGVGSTKRPYTFEHYSNRPDLTTLDPAYMGTGQAGEELGREAVPSLKVYEAGTSAEPRFRGKPMYTASGDFAIYDISKDTQGFVQAAKGDPFTFEKALEAAGYDGITNSAAHPGSVNLFKPLQPHSVRLPEGVTIEPGTAALREAVSKIEPLPRSVPPNATDATRPVPGMDAQYAQQDAQLLSSLNPMERRLIAEVVGEEAANQAAVAKAMAKMVMQDPLAGLGPGAATPLDVGLERHPGWWANLVDRLWDGREGAGGVRGIIDRYTPEFLGKAFHANYGQRYLAQADAFRTARRGRKTGINIDLQDMVLRTTEDLRTKFNPAERRELYRVISRSEGVALRVGELEPAKAQQAMDLIATATRLGRAAVDAGIMSEDTYAFFAGRHLSKFYKDKLGQRFLEGIGMGKRQYHMEGPHFRGLSAEVPLDDIAKMQGEGWQVFGKLPDTPLDIQTARSAILKWAQHTGLTPTQMEKLVAEHPSIAGKLLRDKGYGGLGMDRPVALPAAEKLTEVGAGGGPHARGQLDDLLERVGKTVNARATLRKDLPAELRARLGEIEDPVASVLYGWSNMIRDIHTQKFYKGIASNPQWSWKPTIEESQAASVQMRDLRPPGYAADAPFNDRWEYLGDSPLLGALKGTWAKAPIAREITAIQDNPSNFSKLARETNSLLKMVKIIPPFNVLAWGRNGVTNLALNHMGGLPWYRVDVYARGLRDMHKVSKGLPVEEWELARKVINFGGRSITSDISGHIRDGLDIFQKTDFAPLAYVRWVRKMADTVSKKMGGQVYGFIEDWMKYSKYLSNRDQGLSPIAAGQDASRTLFDYDEVGSYINWLRNSPIGSPFVTFTYKAVPFMLRESIKHPIRAASVLLGFQAWNSLQGTDNVKKYMPSWATPMNMVDEFLTPWLRIPATGPTGTQHYINTSYFSPWGDIGDQGNIFPSIPRAVEQFIPTGGLVLSPLEAALNVRVRQGGQVAPETPQGVPLLGSGESALRRAGHAWRGVGPTTLGTTERRVRRSLQGLPAPGQQTPQNPLQALLGGQVLSVNPTLERDARIGELEAEVGRLESAIRQAGRGTGVFAGTSDKERDDHIRRLERELDAVDAKLGKL